jgi:DNA-binding winged helix-turn-helix (wHTH) protein/TolB-like protein
MPAVLRFDRFEFHPAAGELIAGGEVVRLEPQPARVLAVLAARAGRVVTREELRREIWPADVFVDFERGLNYCIRQVRGALGDAASTPRFIETLPKRGYRFLVPVAALAEDEGAGAAPAPAAPPATAPAMGSAAREAPARRRPRLRLSPAGAALAALAILAILVAAFAAVARTPRARPLPPLPTLAVTLFDNETGQQELDRMAQVLTDTLVERLARDRARWSVIGNAAVLAQPRPFRNLERIASSLHADLIVLGQILPGDRGLTVLTHLIRARDERHLWVGRFTTSAPAAPGDADRICASVAVAAAQYAGEAR